MEVELKHKNPGWRMPRINFRVAMFMLKYRIGKMLVKAALSVVKNFAKDRNIIRHAKNEFIHAWGIDVDASPKRKKEYCDMQLTVCEDILDILSTQCSHEDSGFSMGYKVGILNKLMRFKPISRLTLDNSEFTEVGNDMWQNKRDSSVFMDKDGNVSSINSIKARSEYRIKSDLIARDIEIKSTVYPSSLFVISRDGTLKCYRPGFAIDKSSFDNELSFIINSYEVEIPDGWFIFPICKESDLDEYRRLFTLEENPDRIERELDYKDGVYRDNILSGIEAAGKKMYGKKFKLNFK